MTPPRAEPAGPTVEMTPSPNAVSSEAFDRASLDRSLIKGVAWTGGVKWATQLATWVSTLLVAKYLSPEDYGLVGMAAVYLGLLTMLSEAGLGTTVIAMRDLRGAALAQMHALALIVGLVGFVVSCVIAQPLAAFFDAPALRAVVIALSANFVVISLRTVPQATLQRQLRFGRVALIDGVNSIVTAATSVTLALMGFRYWSLVIAALAGSLTATTMALVSQPTPFQRPKLDELHGALRVSRDIVIGSIAWYVFQSADFFVAGKLLGASAVGAYTFARTLAYSVVEKVTGLLTGVTSPIFSAAKHDPLLLKRYLTQITGALSLVLLPACVGLALVAGDLLGVVGDKWQPAVVPLQVLVLYAGVRSLTPILSQALTISGEANFTMKRSVIAAVVLPIGFVIGARWGITGISVAWIICHAPVVVVPLLRRVSTHLGIGPSAFVPVLRPSLVSTGAMTLAVLGLATSLPAGIPPLAMLVIKIAVGAAAYAAVLWFVFRDHVLALVRAATQLRANTSAPAAR